MWLLFCRQIRAAQSISYLSTVSTKTLTAVYKMSELCQEDWGDFHSNLEATQ